MFLDRRRCANCWESPQACSSLISLETRDIAEYTYSLTRVHESCAMIGETDGHSVCYCSQHHDWWSSVHGGITAWNVVRKQKTNKQTNKQTFFFFFKDDQTKGSKSRRKRGTGEAWRSTAKSTVAPWERIDEIAEFIFLIHTNNVHDVCSCGPSHI